MLRWIVAAALAGVAAFAVYHPAHRTQALATPQALTLRPARPPATAAPTVVVYVAGAVAHPGLYRLKEGARADDAVRRAGGFARGADDAEVNLASLLEDGDEVRVPRLGESHASARNRSSIGPRRRKRRNKHRALPGQSASLDLNSADAASLATLPGIGPGLAERIVAFRTENGPFGSLDDLNDVAGMTVAKTDALARYVSVAPRR